MRNLMRITATAGMLLALVACSDPEVSIPAGQAQSDVLVANTKAEAIAQCKTLPEDLIPDCFAATVNTDW